MAPFFSPKTPASALSLFLLFSVALLILPLAQLTLVAGRPTPAAATNHSKISDQAHSSVPGKGHQTREVRAISGKKQPAPATSNNGQQSTEVVNSGKEQPVPATSTASSKKQAGGAAASDRKQTECFGPQEGTPAQIPGYRVGGGIPAVTGDGSVPAAGLGGGIPPVTGDGSIPAAGVGGGIPAVTGDGSVPAAGLGGGIPAVTGGGGVPAAGAGDGSVPAVGMGGGGIPAVTGDGSVPAAGVGGGIPAVTGGGGVPAVGAGDGSVPAAGAGGGSVPAAGIPRYLPGNDDTFVPNPGFEVPNPSYGGATP